MSHLIIQVKMYYIDLFRNISREFEKSLEEISAEFNFDLGDEFEIALSKVLRRILPSKFGVCRGFSTNMEGKSAGDDIIIYDRTRFPTLRLLEEEKFAQKEKIPIEAVYAYIEAKHTINIEGDDRQSFYFATEQVRKVKQLCDNRIKIKPAQISANIDLEKGLSNLGLFFSQPPHLPNYLNPLYTLVFSKNVRRIKSDELLSDEKEIENLLASRKVVSQHAPDLYVLGKNHLVVPFIDSSSVPGGKIVTPFYLPGKSYFEIKVVDGIAYAIALALMFAALDWIRLGSIPWSEIIAQLLNKRKL